VFFSARLEAIASEPLKDLKNALLSAKLEAIVKEPSRPETEVFSANVSLNPAN